MKRVNFSNNQQVSSANLNNMQLFAEKSLDAVVEDTLIPERGYSGFGASKTGPFELTVDVGRLYVAGKVYSLETVTRIDLSANLPGADKKIVLISASGSEADEDVDLVNFLNPLTSTPQAPVYVAQQIAKTHVRVASIQKTVGAQAPEPIAPALDSSRLLIATVILSLTGIDSVEMHTAARVPNLADHEGRIAVIEEWKDVAEPALLAVQDDIARLSSQARPGDDGLSARLAARLAVVEVKLGVPSNATDSLADFHLDPATSDLTHAGSSCKIAEGVRFPDAAASDAALQLLNPLNPDITLRAGLLFPAFTARRRVSSGVRNASVSLSSFDYQTTELVKKTTTRHRIRTGPSMRVCSNSRLWKSGTVDEIRHIFTLPNGETFRYSLAADQPAWADLAKNHVIYRIEQFWEDTVTTDYWDRVATTETISGAGCYESWLCGQDMWVSSIDVPFTSLDTTGSITMVVTECFQNATMNTGAVIGTSTVARANLQLVPDKTKFLFPRPLHWQAGARYAIALVTTANHHVATTPGNAFPGGMFYSRISGVDIADPSKHICMIINACEFAQAVTYVEMQPLQLVGGIVDIDILAARIVPPSTGLTYEIQIAGVWKALGPDTISQLSAGGSQPPLVRFRLCFSGSQYSQPAVDLLASNVHVSRAALALEHYWPHDPITPPAPTSSIRMMARYEAWEPAHHSVSAKLLSGAGYATETSPSSYSDVLTEDGALERTYVWNLGSLISSMKFKDSATTDTPLVLTHVANRTMWVL
ncbi:hypothetical protein [Methylosinus sp. Sm6]|uniref:hypothetical protein n=1 Tax=Methylosinus sp. Sm6 TaxID=2866948 RepID=UPI001C9949B4|nr:hypothetical protein [Methylosinus sp. Sm6]MBY6243738.1 hypothetical protein [Methylosinus sp. Sm6]